MEQSKQTINTNNQNKKSKQTIKTNQLKKGKWSKRGSLAFCEAEEKQETTKTHFIPLKESKMAKTRNKFGGKSVHFHKKMKPGGVAETFGKRVAVDLQLCDLNKKTII